MRKSLSRIAMLLVLALAVTLVPDARRLTPQPPKPPRYHRRHNSRHHGGTNRGRSPT
jgi:hypothetical protein